MAPERGNQAVYDLGYYPCRPLNSVHHPGLDGSSIQWRWPKRGPSQLRRKADGSRERNIGTG